MLFGCLSTCGPWRTRLKICCPPANLAEGLSAAVYPKKWPKIKFGRGGLSSKPAPLFEPALSCMYGCGAEGVTADKLRSFALLLSCLTKAYSTWRPWASSMADPCRDTSAAQGNAQDCDILDKRVTGARDSPGSFGRVDGAIRCNSAWPWILLAFRLICGSATLIAEIAGRERTQ